MRKTASVLLGSGFSVPDGLPTVAQINDRLSKINESEIIISSDMRAWFLNGQKDPNRWTRRDERLFVQEFLDFYNENVLNGEPFHYETFYDYYSAYLHDKKNEEEIEFFYRTFGEKHLQGPDRTNCYNRISAFNRTYNQLLASLLNKIDYQVDVSYSGGNPKYGSFEGFLRELLKTHDVKVHTLNHDLLFEWLAGHSNELSDSFTDGYHQVAGSKYYGLLRYPIGTNGLETSHKTHYVKLTRFADRFDKPLSLYKLHGSIDSLIVHEPAGATLRVKQAYGVTDLLVESQEAKTGEYSFKGLHSNVDPDFLSGTTNKMRFYGGDPHYMRLFEHFQENLKHSEFLIVVGYGFRDPGINDYLENNFLKFHRRMLVIDPNPNLSKSPLVSRPNVRHLSEGICSLTYNAFIELLEELKAPDLSAS